MARKILLADDSVTAQNMGRKILADAGYEVLTVNNGSAALKKIAEAKPELIVLDVYMPGYSGLEVCQRLKEAQETARIPVLLTVGKLEPFKPEEAKRVRADGFIVKPFEASELLSALSKLEDKMVPRSESSKAGRFARANAALDEARDKTVAIDEDSGWKNRIAFPSKKKKVEDQPPVEDPAIYNPVNKDLRTVVDHKLAAQPYPEEKEDEKVNLEALAPQGLPKDVTPEEIAALAAAAAQVKATVEGAKAAEAAEVRASEKSEAPPTEADKTHKADEVMPSPADVMAAIVALETESVTGPAANGANGSSSRSSDEPVTMAVAANSEQAAVPARWTAVAVALAHEENTVSLEQEMQRAQEPKPPQQTVAVAEQTATAAVAVAEAKFEPAKEPEAIPPAAEASITEPVPQLEAVTPQVPESQPETSQSPADQSQGEASQTSVVANMATEAIAAAVQQLEAVAAAYEAERSAGKSSESTGTQVSDFAQAAVELTQPVQIGQTLQALEQPSSSPAGEAKAAEDQVGASTEEVPVPHETEAEVASAASEIADQKQSLPENDSRKADAIETEASPRSESHSQLNSDETLSSTAITGQETQPASPAEQESKHGSYSHLAAEAPVPVTGSSNAGGSSFMAKKESEIAETTAAAWASWRRIRETGDTKPTALEQDEAAMAVAAGAEKAPEEVDSADPEEIASIVDSVLADLRPKIVEEISRKLGKKK